jgi:ubiquinone/menaquinone biosynthesis C-methylase UbiE
VADRFQEIYAHHAADYEALVSREDYQGNILRTLNQIKAADGTTVVELGAGTGRLTRLLAPAARRIHAFDLSPHMLSIARATLPKTGAANWTLAAGDNRRVPIKSGMADIAIAGWSFGHMQGWYPDTWRDEMKQILSEMRRVLKPGGMAIILETMTTGSETPHPPHDGLAAYYAWLENEQGFSTTNIRTDYKFESLDEAERLARFFFGDAMGDRVVRENWVILPECTGVWWRQF